MSQRKRRARGAWAGAVALCLLAAGGLVSLPVPDSAEQPAEDGRNAVTATAPDAPLGAFVGSGADGVRRLAALQRWLGGTNVRVGHTYLPGDHWSRIEGEPGFLRPWAQWRRAAADRMFVLNVPMMERNEEGVPDAEVRRLLLRAASGAFDEHFRRLAWNLVEEGVPDTVIVLGWEMNGTTYTHRCGPDPKAWQAYWNRIVIAMRSVPGQKFRFDFAPSRGEDAVGWTKCYPGDSAVDIIGMDSYDQPPGETFDEMIRQPYGLQKQVDFAAQHKKRISYPEWGLFRNGDNPEFVRRMLNWMAAHKPLYQTITDYCPHGVWRCRENPQASRVFRHALYDLPDSPTAPSAPATPTPPQPPRPPAPARRDNCLYVDLGRYLENWFGVRKVCIRLGLLQRLLGRGD
ncbi:MULTISPECIES: glycoside hydrolase family 26 protein [unclassified Streptomyces]|uniref:glycoside hydrolase family 26 protein n=1 Tax=unclassified Streptomyces TaxID=2593676 RepID=UPI0037F3FB20